MTTKTAAQKSCGPRLSDTDLPSHGWDVDRLGNYAKRQYQAILKNERTLAPYYWRLGLALSLARKSFNHGQWGQFLASLAIDKTRCSKACLIYGAFSTADDVAGMSVEDAYEARRHKSQKQESILADQPAVLSVRFNKALAKVEKATVEAFKGVSELTKPEKQELLDSLCQTISCLQDHAQRLEGEIAADQAAQYLMPPPTLAVDCG